MQNERTQIFERLADLAFSLDARDWVALGSCFSDSGTAYGAIGRDEVVSKIRSYLGGCGPSQHLLGNHRVDPNGDQAESRTYVRVHHQGLGDFAELTYECFGEYTDRWVRTPHGWQIQSRVFNVTHALGDIRTLQPG